MPLYKVLYDLRFPESVAFARRAATLGVDVHAIEGDMTRFWYDDLHHRWQRGPAAIAGLTAHGPLFCLERLAWDQGMRVVFRAEHKFAGSTCVAHELNGPIAMLRDTSRPETNDWAARMADVVTQCPRGRAEIARIVRSSNIRANGRPRGLPLLVGDRTREPRVAASHGQRLGRSRLSSAAGAAAAQDGERERGNEVFQYWCAPCHAPGPRHPGTQALEALYKGAKPAALEQRTDLVPASDANFRAKRRLGHAAVSQDRNQRCRSRRSRGLSGAT